MRRMRGVALAIAALASVAIAGCSKNETDPKYDTPTPLDKMSTPEWCAYYQNFLSNPQLTAKNRQIDLQRMKARGCPGV